MPDAPIEVDVFMCNVDLDEHPPSLASSRAKLRGEKPTPDLAVDEVDDMFAEDGTDDEPVRLFGALSGEEIHPRGDDDESGPSQPPEAEALAEELPTSEPPPLAGTHFDGKPPPPPAPYPGTDVNCDTCEYTSLADTLASLFSKGCGFGAGVSGSEVPSRATNDV